MLAAGDRNGKNILANVLDIPVANETYDFIVSRGVLLSHVGPGNTDRMLKEIHRILSKGGECYLDYITHFKNDEYRYQKTKNSFLQNEISEILLRNGFTVEKFFDNDSYRTASVLIKKI